MLIIFINYFRYRYHLLLLLPPPPYIIIVSVFVALLHLPVYALPRSTLTLVAGLW